MKTRSSIGNFIGAESRNNAERLFFARSNHPPDFFDNHLVPELRKLKRLTARVQGRTSLLLKFEFPTTPTPQLKQPPLSEAKLHPCLPTQVFHGSPTSASSQQPPVGRPVDGRPLRRRRPLRGPGRLTPPPLRRPHPHPDRSLGGPVSPSYVLFIIFLIFSTIVFTYGSYIIKS